MKYYCSLGFTISVPEVIYIELQKWGQDDDGMEVIRNFLATVLCQIFFKVTLSYRFFVLPIINLVVLWSISSRMQTKYWDNLLKGKSTFTSPVRIPPYRRKNGNMKEEFKNEEK